MSREWFDLLIQAVVKDKCLAKRLVSQEPMIVHAKNDIGETVLHYLVVENQIDAVAWLLNFGADINTINAFGNTPLSEAASLGYLDLCKFLLKNGADPRITTSEGDSALSEAAINNEYSVVELLLDYINSNDLLRNYFSAITYDVLLDKNSQSAQLIKSKGLIW